MQQHLRQVHRPGVALPRRVTLEGHPAQVQGGEEGVEAQGPEGGPEDGEGDGGVGGGCGVEEDLVEIEGGPVDEGAGLRLVLWRFWFWEGGMRASI